MQTQANLQVPEQFSSVFGLGAPISVYPVGVSNRWVSAISALICLGVAGLAVLYGIYDASVQTSRYGPAVLSRALTGPLILGAVFGLIGVLLAYNAFTSWNKAVVVYDKGLGYSDNNGVQMWGWHEVEWYYISVTKHYHNGVYTGTTYLYTLVKADGSKLKLDNKFKGIEALGQTITRGVAPHQYQKLVTAIKSGQTVTLGPIGLNQEGISFGKKAYKWDEVEQVGIQRGYVSVKKKDGGWFSGATASVASIPNLDAFLSVVDQIVKVKTN